MRVRSGIFGGVIGYFEGGVKIMGFDRRIGVEGSQESGVGSSRMGFGVDFGEKLKKIWRVYIWLHSRVFILNLLSSFS